MHRLRRLIPDFSWLFWVLMAVGFVYDDCRLAKAGECGRDAADYTARRTLTIGEDTKAYKVYVSGTKTREEQDEPNGRRTVILRLPESGANYAFDPERKTGFRLPFPAMPSAPKQPTRLTVDKRLDGTTVRHTEVLTGGDWKDLSTTTCRSDGVMLEQVFILFDPKGNLLNGHVIQRDIIVGQLPESLFEVPKSIVIQHP